MVNGEWGMKEQILRICLIKGKRPKLQGISIKRNPQDFYIHSPFPIPNSPFKTKTNSNLSGKLCVQF